MINVVYFNQWFSSIAPVIEDLKRKLGNKIMVIASSKNPEHAYKNVVDKFIVEDWEEGYSDEITENNYIRFVRNLCEEYNVDYFFVKKNAEAIAARYDTFNNMGVKLILDDYKVLKSIESKCNVYRTLEKELPEKYKYLIPEYYQFGHEENSEMDKAKLDDILYKAENEPWCLKLDIDEGGASFRQIKTDKITIDSLNKFRVNEITLNETHKMLSELNDSEYSKLIFMELLDEPEISIDCYNSKHGLITICREKLPGSRVQKIYHNSKIHNICEEICKIYGFKFAFNIQFRRKHNGKEMFAKNLRLLEINPRMSGGTYYSTLYDMNIAEFILKDELGISTKEEYEKYMHFSDKGSLMVTFVEQAIKLD